MQRRNAHPVARARQPFDRPLLPTANTIRGVSFVHTEVTLGLFAENFICSLHCKLRVPR